MDLWNEKTKRETSFIPFFLIEKAKKEGSLKKFSFSDRLRLSCIEEFSDYEGSFPRGVPLKYKYSLRQDQEEVVKKMLLRESKREEGVQGGVLAPKPGLGKTLDLLITSLCQPRKYGTLIVVSKTLIRNVVDEITKFFGSKINFCILHPEYTSYKTHPSCYFVDPKEITRKDLKKIDFVITTYELTSLYSKKYIQDITTKFGKNTIEFRLPAKSKRDDKTKKGYEILYNTPWDRVACDESHENVNNIKTQKFKSFMALYGTSRWCLSGTCIKNRSVEAWAQLHAIGYTDISSPKEWSKQGKKFFEERDLARFFIFSNYEKAEIEMPDLEVQRVYLDFDENVKKVYNDLFTETTTQVKKYLNGLGNYMEAIKLITKLRQISSVPCISRSSEVGKTKVPEGLEESKEGGIFCVKAREAKRIISTLPKQEKVIIFSNYVEALRVLEKSLNSSGIKTGLLCSDVKKRSEFIDEFKKSKDTRVLLSSFKLGGVGLNLQFIKTCIFLDPSWNEATHLQALQRCWRVGQKQKVKVYQLTMKRSIEEKIYQLCSRKSEITDDFEEGKINQNETGTLKIEAISSFFLEE